MDLLNGSIKKIYRRYLTAAFGSAMITSVYSIVDMAMVGQYQGPDGTASLAVVAPIWNIVYSLGLLMGIGGSVLLSTKRAERQHGPGSESSFFSAAVIGAGILAVLSWGGLICLEKPLLVLFGADEALLPLAISYIRPIKVVFPLFLFNQMLAAFLRNDNDPGLATKAVLCGGIFNIIGDYLFVFVCDMGVFGAGLATAIGSVLSFFLMLTHFFGARNTLLLVKPKDLGKTLLPITAIPTFFVDVSMGILTILFNRQIMRYLGAEALSIYGPIINVSTFVQCCGYSIGQASQPIISVNYGAQQGERIRQTLRYALWTSAVFGVFWTVLSMAVPNLYIRIFMDPTPRILAAAPSIIRVYSLSFLLLPFNIFSTYYFQAIMKPRAAYIVSISRGLAVSGTLILILPHIAPSSFLWLAMPATELIVMIYAATRINRYTKRSA